VVKAKREREKERKRKEIRREGMEEGRGENEKLNKKRMMEVEMLVEEWKIWDKKEEAAKSEEKAKKLVPQRFHK